VLLSWHIAETREKAIQEARRGLMHWHNRYSVATLQRPGAVAFKSEDEAVEKTTAAGPAGSTSVIGTPDDLVKMIKDVYTKSGGFGTVVGFVHDWANPENTFRSWDMVARYVIPEVNGFVTKLRESERHLQVNRDVFVRAGQAIMAKIMENKDAAEALKVTQGPRFAAAGAQVPKEIGDKGKPAHKGKQEAAE
jgi:limonene 1,2-monooxygenase